MTRKQRVILYAAILILLIWGLDLIVSIRDGYLITLKTTFSPFHFSQLIYSSLTLFLMYQVCNRFFVRRKYLLFGLSILGLVVVFSLCRYLIEQVVFPVLFDGLTNYPPKYGLLRYVLDNIYYAYICIGIGFLAFLLDNQVKNQKKQATLMQQNKEAELSFLRSQINPHFLFNTLNNIYSLVYEQSPKAPDAMLQLSALMRYMLYEKKDLVAISREWSYIQSFITLQQLRLDHALHLDLEVKGDMDQHWIPPYLLIPFIENAFKHGDFRNDPLRIRLSVHNNHMHFEVNNRISTRNKDEVGGIGMDNVRRRLELLYPGRYELNCRSAEGFYTATLQLNL